MARMGHGSPRAALIYQHATQDADIAIAAAVNAALVEAMRSGKVPGLMPDPAVPVEDDDDGDDGNVGVPAKVG